MIYDAISTLYAYILTICNLCYIISVLYYLNV